MTKQKLIGGLALALIVLTMCAVGVVANEAENASATVNCTGYTLTVTAHDLNKGTGNPFSISYSFTVNCPGPTSFPVSGTITSTQTGANFQDQIVSTTGTWLSGGGSLPNGCTVTPGNVELLGENPPNGTVGPQPITIIGSTSLICPTTTSVCTTGPQSLSYNVSEKPADAKEIVWFNSHFKLKGTVPTTDFTVNVTDQTITFGPSLLTVPNAVIHFSAAATCASTSFNIGLNQWETTIPLSYATKADEIFSSGLAYILPANFAQNVNNVSWNATFTSDAPALTFQFQYGAANYLSTDGHGHLFPLTAGAPDYNTMKIDPAHNAPTCNGYNSGDHAGAPEDSVTKGLVTGGGSGGGGSNWTGSWSSTPTYICAKP